MSAPGNAVPASAVGARSAIPHLDIDPFAIDFFDAGGSGVPADGGRRLLAREVNCGARAWAADQQGRRTRPAAPAVTVSAG